VRIGRRARSSAETRNVVRFYPHVRTAHLERADDLRPAMYFYLKTRGDWDEGLARQHPEFRKTTITGLIAHLLGTPPEFLEVPEPMWLQFAPASWVISSAAKIGAKFHGNEVRVISYAIENADPSLRPKQLSFLPRALWKLSSKVAIRICASNIDKLVFGTPAARDNYCGVFSNAQKRRLVTPGSLVIAIPSRCPCTSDTDAKVPNSVLFVGAFEERKGFDVLTDIWPDVKSRNPLSRITIIGHGPLLDRAELLSCAGLDVEFHHSPERSVIHREYREAAIVVLLSAPTNRWREQIGLPIVEGLAHGCRVVTTSETGLASWLSEKGMPTLDVPYQPGDAVSAICGELDRSSTGLGFDRSSLPALDGRIAADRAFFEAD
jgi:glycosyltransferase involved in cell wall biosynthesis